MPSDWAESLYIVDYRATGYALDRSNLDLCFPSAGKFISFVRPLSMGNSFLGVYHARIAVTELFRAAFRYFHAKPLSYFFITDSSDERESACLCVRVCVCVCVCMRE